MAMPLWQVRHVITEEKLPKQLIPGTAYFVQDQQYIVVDMNDGRGPVKYGDKPGPKGDSGEPQMYMQEQLDDLAHASLRTTITIYGLARSTQQYMRNIEGILENSVKYLMEQDDKNAEAVITSLKLLHEKVNQYDDAIATLAKNVAMLYPADWGKDESE